MDVIISNDLFIIKTHVFHGQRISGVSPRTSHAFLYFLDFHHWSVYEPVRAFHSRGCLTLLATTHYTFCHVMQPCDSVGHPPTVQAHPCMVIDHNHALTPIQCDVPCICNVMHHCMLYHDTYIMNATWTIETIQFTMYYGKLYQKHITSK